MPKIKLLLFLLFLSVVGFGQVPDYLKKLDTLVAYIGEPKKLDYYGITYYMVGKNYISEEMYNKYLTAKSVRAFCSPCFLREYDYLGRLKYESVSYQGCYIGELKSYAPTGKLQMKATYKTPSKDELPGLKECPLVDGTFSFYDENEKITYIEQWKDGLFISQKPEQDFVQAWQSKIELNGKLIEDWQNVNVSSLKDLKVKQDFKSKNRPIKTELEFVVFPIGYDVLVFRENIENIQQMNFYSKLELVKIPENKIAMIQLKILSDDQTQAVVNITTRGILGAADYFEDFKSYAAAGDKENAVLTINKAIELDPVNVGYLQAKGQLHYELKEYQEAQSALEKTMAIKPSFQACHYLALTMKESGNLEEAIELNLKSTTLTKSKDELSVAYQHIGSIRTLQNDYDAAYLNFRKALEYNSENVVVLNNISVVCGKIGRENETLNYLMKITEIDTSFFMAHLNIGFHYSYTGKYKKAIAEFDYVLKRDPSQSYAMSNKAFCQFKLKKIDESLKTINQSLLIDPSNAYAYKNRALILIEMKRSKEACEDLRTAIDLGFTKEYGNEVEELRRVNCK